MNQTKNLEGREAVTMNGMGKAVMRSVGNKAIEWKDARPGECGARSCLLTKTRGISVGNRGLDLKGV